ncbi:putative phosphatidylinositol-3,4-bisphosphate 4-phosphatase [Helianthus annuus]|nr:putative phosphatidylinositol-3,4-bisphosphate 4-phosphatase [Helianthus annuus]
MEKMDQTAKLYSRMRLWELPDQYVVEPIDGSSGSCLAVNHDGSITLLGSFVCLFVCLFFSDLQLMIYLFDSR